MRPVKRVAGAAALVLTAGVLYFFFFLAAAAESRINTVAAVPPYAASDRARVLHRQLVVADLHADTLLWDRDLLARSVHGHVDVPRLLEGNVALQAFTIVTKAPRDIRLENNDARTDVISLLALAERWPVRSWRSLEARALHQASKLSRAAAASDGRLTLITTSSGLRQYLDRRAVTPGITAALLGVEGAHALDGRLDNLDDLFAAGVRMIAPTHLADNELGGSAQGTVRGGLTDMGKALIGRVEARRMILDLAHSSPRAFADAVAIATRPVVVSHTGVAATCPNGRNLTDDQLRAVAKTGGLVGIGYWPTATCGTDAAAVARAIRHAVAAIGAEHVALGSDFDGAVEQPFDTTGLVQITDALLGAGLSEAEIRAVMGGNVIRLFGDLLP